MSTDDKTPPAKTAIPAKKVPDQATPEPIDPRLDNRTGSRRPPLETFPAKPQQIDGPDLPGQAEHSRRTLANHEDTTPRKGMSSPGPHGLGDEAAG